MASNKGCNLRKTKPPGYVPEEDDLATRSLPPVLGVPTDDSNVQRPPKAPSECGSSASHSSHINKIQIGLETDRKIAELEAEEDALKCGSAEIDVVIKNLEDELKESEEQHADITSWENEDEGKKLKKDMQRLKTEIRIKKGERDIRIPGTNAQLKAITTQKKLLRRQKDLDIVILDEFQADDDGHDGDAIENSECQKLSRLISDYDQEIAEAQEKLNHVAVEDEETSRKLLETIKWLDGQQQEKREKLNALRESTNPLPKRNKHDQSLEELTRQNLNERNEDDDLQRKQELAKALDDVEKAKKDADKAKKDADKAKKDADEAKKRAKEIENETSLKLKEKELALENLTKLETLSIPEVPSSTTIPSVSGVDQLALVLAQAIGRINPTSSNNDNGKFLARQSHAKDLPFFNGNPEEWLTFKNAFTRTTNICAFSDDENLNRLQKCLKGDAMTTVKPLMDSPANVARILTKLETRFGQPDFIINAMIQRVRDAPRIKDDKLETIIELGNAVDGLTQTLQSLKREDHLQNPMLLTELEEKLTPLYKMEWRLWLTDQNKKKDVISFAEWLDRKTTVACSLCPPRTNNNKDDKKPARQHDDRPTWDKRKNRREGAMAFDKRGEQVKASPRTGNDGPNKVRTCNFCRKPNHHITKCEEFLAMDIPAKNKSVKEKRLCYGCLNYGHMTKDCRSQRKCGKDGCNSLHHAILHMKREVAVKHQDEAKVHKENVNLADDDSGREEDTYCTVNGNIGQQKRFPYTKLGIIPIRVNSPNGFFIKYALLDPGASVSLITETLAEELNLEGEKVSLTLTGINKSEPKMSSREVNFEIFRSNGEGPFKIVKACTTDRLPLPTQSMDAVLLKKWKHLKGIKIESFQNGKPEILIGNDHSDLIQARDIKEGPPNSPIAIRTLLGWVLSGIKSQETREEVSFLISEEQISKQDEWSKLHLIVKQHMRIEDLGIKQLPLQARSKEDKLSQDLMDKDIRKLEVPLASEHVWEARLLRKQNDLPRADGYDQAFYRLKSMEKRMDKDAAFAQKYIQKITEYEDKSFARKLNPDEIKEGGKWTFYIPHFMAYNPKKEKPYRFVFDCAAKVNGYSLNDRLMIGADKLIPLPVILYGLRERRIAVSGDIQDMFHRIKIGKEDAESQRFLFRGMERSSKPDVYQMEVLIFGASCSPTLAQEVKNCNALGYIDKYPEAVEAIITKFYVDDYVDSFDFEEEAIERRQQINQICRDGGFLVQKWRSNSQKVLDSIPSQLCATVKDMKSLKTEELGERILGLYWKPNEDIFTFALNFIKVKKEVLEGKRLPTQCELLSLVMSIYDPLGFLALFTVRAKMILQDTWRMKTEWEGEIPRSTRENWEDWLEQLKQIHTFKIPRCYSVDLSTADDVQLHVFGDASEQAYGSVAYFRITKGEIVTTALIGAKAKVAPLKAISIPRSELQAALICSRFAKYIRESHSIKINRSVYWTDSEVTYAWVTSDGKKYPQFVANRVGEIQELTDAHEWNWLPGKENVADELTRDKRPCDWTIGSRWVNGPSFLLKEEQYWPKEKPRKVSQDALEVKQENIFIIDDKIQPDILDISRYSTWNKAVRVRAYVNRVLAYFQTDKSTRTKRSKQLDSMELEKAERWWWRWSQEQSFPEELAILESQSNKQPSKVNKTSKLFQLNPFIDQYGIIRATGRLKEAFELPYETKHPVILDAKNNFTSLIIDHYHRKGGHHGKDRIANDLKQRFYINNCRNAVRSAWHQCQRCKNASVEPIVPEMGQLPSHRLESGGAAFRLTGVDYFGPLTVTVGRSRQKRYVALFTCMTSRAVHLELVNSLSTDHFILALRRFIARRGRPDHMYSDNGTNFVGANNEMLDCIQRINQDKVTEVCTSDKIMWHFNPPAAPHMGGAWERLVRSVKVALYAVLKEQAPKEDVLYTLLTEAEDLVDSHPLTDVSFDLDDRPAITPNDVLKPLAKNGFIDLPGEGDLNARELWRRAEELANQFWGRWRKEYLPTLLKSPKWNKAGDQIKLGDIVLIVDPNMKRGSWPIGKVINIFPGRDGKVRVAEVQTAKGTYTRPVAKLAVLDVRKESLVTQEKVVAAVTRAAAKRMELGKKVPNKPERDLEAPAPAKKIRVELPMEKAQLLQMLTIRQEVALLKKSRWYYTTLENYKNSFKNRQRKEKTPDDLKSDGT